MTASRCRYAYVHEASVREHRVVDLLTGKVLTSLDASWRYPANAGAVKRYARELCEGKR